MMIAFQIDYFVVVVIALIALWILTVILAVTLYRPDALKWRRQNRMLIADREAFWRFTVTQQAMAETRMRALR